MFKHPYEQQVRDLIMSSNLIRFIKHIVFLFFCGVQFSVDGQLRKMHRISLSREELQAANIVADFR